MMMRLSEKKLNDPDLNKVIAHILECWLSWIDEGASKRSIYFSRDVALCNTVSHVACTKGMGATNSSRHDAIYKAFPEMLPFHAMGERWPFGGQRVYFDEAAAGTIHLNKERVEWARKQVEILKSK